MDTDINAAEQQARDLLESRMTSVRALVKHRHRLDQIREELSTAETEDARLYRQAVKDGWTSADLKRVGINEPGKVTRTRRTQPAPGAPSAQVTE